MKVKDLAEMVGLSPSYLSLILSGDRGNLSDLHKDAVALALGTTVARLYSSPDEEFFAPEPEERRTVSSGRPGYLRAFEDFLSALNVKDPVLLKALYRELNLLSDSEMSLVGRAFHNALVSWGKETKAPGGDPSGATPYGFVPKEPDCRVILGLVACLEGTLGALSPEMLKLATGWSEARLLRALGALMFEGFLLPRQTPEGTVFSSPEGGKSVYSRLISGEIKSDACLALADFFAENGRAQEGAVGELYLEGRDLLSARVWFSKAAEASFSEGAWHKTKDYLHLIRSLDAALDSPQDKKAMVNQMMVTTCLNMGELDLALAYQRSNILQWESENNQADLAMGLSVLSHILSRKGLRDEALEELTRALRLCPEGSSQSARLMLNIAGVRFEMGSLAAAQGAYDKALDIATASQDSGMMAQALLGLGRICLAKADEDRARTFFNRGLALAEKKVPVVEAQARLWLGQAHFAKADYRQSAGELDKAKRVLEGISDPSLTHSVNIWFARCLLRGADRNGWVEAKGLAQDSYAHFRASSQAEGTVYAQIALAEAESVLGSREKTFALFSDALKAARESKIPVLEIDCASSFAAWLESAGDELAPVMKERSNWLRANLS